MPEIPAGRRALEKNEHLFLGLGRKKKCPKHHWMLMQGAHGEVIACGLCGKIKPGETMPAGWTAVMP